MILGETGVDIPFDEGAEPDGENPVNESCLAAALLLAPDRWGGTEALVCHAGLDTISFSGYT